MTSEEVSAEDAARALENVLTSKEFEGADRLKEFLSYVVQETLDGRGHLILGKRIAQDVYGRRTQSDAAAANVVRVDAGRLRRRLEAYYQKEGGLDRTRISIDKGGYAPRFHYTTVEKERAAGSDTRARSPDTPRTRAIWAVAVVAASVAIGGSVAIVNQNKTDGGAASAFRADLNRQLQRAVLFEASPAALQARNLAEEARTMMFPATQATRLRAALALFEEAIELDPTYYGGYAGAAQASAMFAGLAPLGPERNQMMSRAKVHAQTAVELGPTAAWSQSALAIVYMFERDYDRSNRLSLRAVSLDPEDLIALEIDAIIAFFSGDFERARASASPERHAQRVGTRFPWRNVYGNASFYLGAYDASIEFLFAAAQNGEPVSEINTAHLIASLQASGRHEEAAQYTEEYMTTWPNSRIEELMYRLFAHEEDAKALITELESAGWRRPGGN